MSDELSQRVRASSCGGILANICQNLVESLDKANARIADLEAIWLAAAKLENYAWDEWKDGVAWMVYEEHMDDLRVKMWALEAKDEAQKEQDE